MQLIKPDYLHLHYNFKLTINILLFFSMKTRLIHLILVTFLVTASQALIAQSTRASFGFSYLFKKNNTDKYLEVLEVIENGDAKVKMIKSGNLIEEIEGQKIEGLYDKNITDIIISAKANKKLTIKRKGESKPIILLLKEIPTYLCQSKTCTDGKVKVLDVFNLYLYEGDFKNGKYNGNGTITFKGLSKNYASYHFIKQTGIFENGFFVKGVTEYLNGKFEGKAYNGVPQGEGVYTENSGTIYKGNFIDGTFMEGVLIAIDNKGKPIETKFVNGSPVKQ